MTWCLSLRLLKRSRCNNHRDSFDPVDDEVSLVFNLKMIRTYLANVSTNLNLVNDYNHLFEKLVLIGKISSYCHQVEPMKTTSCICNKGSGVRLGLRPPSYYKGTSSILWAILIYIYSNSYCSTSKEDNYVVGLHAHPLTTMGT